MAFLMFTEGKSDIGNNGLPATCTFDLVTKTVTELGAATTYSGGFSVATGTSYAALTQAEPTGASGVFSFSAMEWKTEANTNWSSAVKAVILRNGVSHLLMGWDLAETVNLAAKNRILKVTPTWTQG